jgi:probable phosphoglycerate mutase
MAPSIASFSRAFCFVRHGETDSNRCGLVAGSSDVPLTALGREQARAAAARLAGAGITAVYSSALSRARDTAEPIARALALPVTVIAELNERGWGELEGRPRALRVPGVTPPGAETAAAFRARVLAGLARVDAALPLIVAHSGVFRVLCRELGIAEAAAPVGNALPLRFVPPRAPGGGWHLEPVAPARGSPRL